MPAATGDGEWVDENYDMESDFNIILADHSEFCATLKTATATPLDGRLRVLLEDIFMYLVGRRKNPEDKLVIWSLVEKGVMDVVLDFLSNEDTYEKGRLSRRTTKLLLSSIRIAGLLLDFVHGSGSVPSKIMPVVSRWRKKISKIYDLLWKHRHSVFWLSSRSSSETEVTNDETHKPSPVAHDDMCVFILRCATVPSHTELFLPRTAVQIFLYLWAHSEDLHGSKNCMLVMDLFMGHQHISTRRDELNIVFKSFLTDVEDTRALLRSCTKLLRHEKTTDAPLQRLLLLSHLIVDLCPRETFQAIQIFNIQDPWAVLMRAMLRSCERQLCMGSLDGQGDISMALTLGLSTICTLFSIPEEHSTRIPTYDCTVSQGDAGKLDVISLVAWFTLPAIEHSDTWQSINALTGILAYHGSAVNFAITENIRRDTVRRIVSLGRRYIGPTISALHKYKPINNNTREFKAEMIRAWQEFADDLGLPTSDSWTAQDEAESKVWGRCALRTCLCSRRASHDHKMRVCKGCKRVLYCGLRCQKLDWEEGGHRERCLRWRNAQLEE